MEKALPIFKSLTKTIFYVVPVGLKEKIEKARRRSRLVPDIRTVNRGGKQFRMRVWVNPDQWEGPAQYDLFDRPKSPVDKFLEERERRSKQAEEYTKSLSEKLQRRYNVG